MDDKDAGGYGSASLKAWVSNPQFTIMRKGFDPLEVRGYVTRTRNLIAALEARLAELTLDDEEGVKAPVAGVEPVVDRLANVLREAEASARALRDDARREAGRMVEDARQEASAIVAEAMAKASHVQQQATEVLRKSRSAADAFSARWVEHREPLVNELSDLRERLRVVLDSLALMPEPPSTHDEPLTASVETGAPIEELPSADRPSIEQAADIGQEALDRGEVVAQDVEDAAVPTVRREGQRHAGELKQSVREAASELGDTIHTP
jgi:F0F1-type ATP synthase membrane subunit b/b'